MIGVTNTVLKSWIIVKLHYLKDGKVIIVEFIIPEVPDSNIAGRGVIYLDNIMLAQNPAGKEGSQKQLKTVLKILDLLIFKCGLYCLGVRVRYLKIYKLILYLLTLFLCITTINISPS